MRGLNYWMQKLLIYDLSEGFINFEYAPCVLCQISMEKSIFWHLGLVLVQWVIMNDCRLLLVLSYPFYSINLKVQLLVSFHQGILCTRHK